MIKATFLKPQLIWCIATGILAEQEEGYVTSALQGFKEVVEMQAKDKGEWCVQYCHFSLSSTVLRMCPLSAMPLAGNPVLGSQLL